MIRATGLVKRYKDVEALAGLDLTVPEGKVLALLGPNGAGKTTAVRILATLIEPDGGRRRWPGSTCSADPAGVRARIGLSGQYAAVDEHLTGYENLEMVGRLYGLPQGAGARRGPASCSTASTCRRGRPALEDLLRRHAAPARPRRRAGRRAAGADPRRADHRARRPQPPADVGGHPRAGRLRRDPAADDAVPRGGRPAGRRHRGHRPRPGDRPRHRRRAQGADRRRAGRGRARPTSTDARTPRRVLAGVAGGEVQVDDDNGRDAHRAGQRGPAGADAGAPSGSRTSGSRCSTSGCADRPSTTSS